MISGELPNDMCGAHLCVASSAEVLSRAKCRFKAIMLLPKVSMRLIRSRPRRKNRPGLTGTFLAVTDSITSSSFVLQQMQEEKRLPIRTVKQLSVDQDEVPAFFRNGSEDISTIIWFPQYYFHKTFANAVVELPCVDLLASEMSILLMHEKFVRMTGFVETLEMLIRDAWLVLLQNPEMLRSILKILFGDKEFQRNVVRMSGLHHFGHDTDQGTSALFAFSPPVECAHRLHEAIEL